MPSPTIADRSADSDVGDGSATTSSPAEKTVSGWGITTWPSRRIATTAESGGRRSSYSGRPTDGELSGRVISTIEMRPPSRRISRTRSPTVTASSTMAVRMCGGDTAASTPHCSVNSHSFFGWFTRARTRGTANSCLANSDVTRLSSSSPVAATTTSALDSSAPPSTHGSQPSPRSTLTFGAHSRAFSTTSGSLIDERDVVSSVGEICRQVSADRACTRHDDAHQCEPPAEGGASDRVQQVHAVFGHDHAEVVALLQGRCVGRDESRRLLARPRPPTAVRAR